MDRLKNMIDAWMQAGTLHLPVSDTLVQDMGLLAPFMDGALHVPIAAATVEQDDAAQQVVVRGTGTSQPFQGAQMEVRFTETEGPPRMTLRARFDGTWHFRDSFPDLAQSYLNPFPWTSVTLQFPGDDEKGLWFDGNLGLPDAKFTFFSLFEQFAPQFTGRLQRTDGSYDFRLTHAQALPLDLGFLDHNGFTVGLACKSSTLPARVAARPIYIGGRQVTRRQAADAPSTMVHDGHFFLEAAIKMSIGGQQVQLPLQARIFNLAQDIQVTLWPGQVVEASLEALGTLVGQAIPLPGFLEQLHLAALVQLHAIEIRLSPWLDQKLSSISFQVITTQPIPVPIPDSAHSRLGVETLRLTLRLVNPLRPAQSDWIFLVDTDIRIGTTGLLNAAAVVSKAAPWPILSGRLAPDHSLKIAELVTHIAGRADTALEGLEIEEFGFQVDTNSGAWRFEAEIGNDWPITDGDRRMHLEQLSFAMQRSPGQDIAIALHAALELGSLRFELGAMHPAEPGAGWHFMGELMDNEEINLAYIVTTLARATRLQWPDYLPAIWVREVDMSYDTGSRDFTFHALTQVEANIGVLDKSHFAAEASIDVASTHLQDGTTALSLDLAAKLLVDSHEIDVSLALDWDEKVLFAHWHDTQGLDMGALLRKLGDFHHDHLLTESGVAFTLTDLAFEYVHTTEEHDFLLTATTGQGLALYIVGQRRGTWQFLINLDYHSPTADAHGVVGTLLRRLQHFRVRRAAVAISTGQFTAFTFPPLPTLPGQSQPEPLAGLRKLDLAQGLYLMAEINLAAGTHPATKALPQGHLWFEALIDTAGPSATLRATLDGPFRLGGQGKDAIYLDPVALYLHLPEPELRLHGEIALCLDATRVRAVGEIELDSSHIAATLNVEFERGQLQFMGIKGLFLDSLGALIGITFEPPGLELGLFGAMHVGDQPQNADRVGIILQLEGEVPVPTFLELEIAKLDIGQMLDMFLERTETGHAGSSGLEISAEFIHLFWAAKGHTLPDGRHFEAGFSFSARLDVLAWQAYAALSASERYGLSGTAVCAEIVIGDILRISGQSQGYSIMAYQDADGDWIKVPDVPEAPDPAHADRVIVPHEIVPPGGPVILFNTNRDSLLHVDAEISIFGFLREKVAIDITAEHLAFELGYELGDMAGLHLHFLVNKQEGFEAGAECHLRLGGKIKFADGPFGTIDLSLVAKASLAIGFSKSRGFWFEVDLNVDLFGIHLPTLHVAIAASITDLAQLPKLLLEGLAEHLQEPLRHLWSFLSGREGELAARHNRLARERMAAFEQENMRYQALFSEHEAAVSRLAETEANKALLQAQLMRDRAERRYDETDLQRASAFVQMGSDRVAEIAGRLAEISLEDPHRQQRRQEIAEWQRQSDALAQEFLVSEQTRKRDLQADRAAETLEFARHIAAQIIAGS